jgi:hypothetical protein
MERLLKLGLILVTICLIAGYGYAQEHNVASINVYPVTKAIVLSRGETAKDTLTVQNVSGRAQHVFILPRQWHMIEENKAIPLESWFKLDLNEFDIEPGEEKKIGYEVVVPEDATGEFATMIAFRPKPKEGQSVNVVFSVSLYVRIKDEGEVNCSMSDFKLWKFEDRKALGVDVTFRNEGNVHLKPRMVVHVQNLINKNLRKTSLRYGKPIYPGKSQKYSGALYNFGLKPGLYKVMVDAQFTNIAASFRKKVYFVVGKDGEIIFTFFKRRTGEDGM